MKKTIAVYPGSFDPPTNGHIDIIKRALKLHANVIVGVTNNLDKNTTFTIEKRVQLLKEALKGVKNVTVESFPGLLVKYLRKKKASIIVRGIRAVSDFEYEFQMALMNRRLDREIETVFLMPDEAYTYLSASMVKQVAKLGGNVSGLVPKCVEKFMRNLKNEK